MELSRSDGSLGTVFGVQSGLAMKSIHMFGSEEQKERWLAPMARMERFGAFALTEPDHGSDSVSLETSARLDGGEYVIDGAKRWIGNGSIADVVVVWARGDDGQVQGFLVERDTPGMEAEVIEGKGSLRAIWQAQIRLFPLGGAHASQRTENLAHSRSASARSRHTSPPRQSRQPPDAT
jgi:glutaryl-CoA dehydrogenase